MNAGFFKIVLIIFISIVLHACAIFKHAEKSVNSPKDSISNFGSARKDGLSHKLLIFNNIDGIIKIEGKENAFNGSLKFVSDSLLVISITSLLNIEIFRIYINNDSMFLLDRTKREYIANSLKSTINKFSEFLNVNSIGDFLLGNMNDAFSSLNFIQLQKGREYSKFGVVYGVNSKDAVNDAIIYYVLDNSNSKPIEVSLQSNEMKFHILYSDYKMFEGSLFPEKMEIRIKNKEVDFLLNIEVGNLKRMENSNTHIFIPDGYKRRV